MSIIVYPRNKGAGFDKDLFEIKNDGFHLLQTWFGLRQTAYLQLIYGIGGDEH
jgi:hypothetical protein